LGVVSLPVGWVALLDESSQEYYYYNEESEVTTWEKPEPEEREPEEREPEEMEPEERESEEREQQETEPEETEPEEREQQEREQQEREQQEIDQQEREQQQQQQQEREQQQQQDDDEEEEKEDSFSDIDAKPFPSSLPPRLHPATALSSFDEKRAVFSPRNSDDQGRKRPVHRKRRSTTTIGTCYASLCGYFTVYYTNVPRIFSAYYLLGRPVTDDSANQLAAVSHRRRGSSMITKPNVNKMIKQLNSQQSATSTTSGFGGTYSPQREQLHIHVLCQGWMYKRGQGGLFSSKKFRKRVSTVCCGGCGWDSGCAGCCLVAKVCTLTPIFSSQPHTPQHHTVLHLGQHHQLPVLLSFQRTRPPVHQSQTPPTTLRLGQGPH
jgi:hypothetical protein